MTDPRPAGDTPGLGAQLWGALRSALTEEDPIAAARRAKPQGAREGAAPSASPPGPLATPDPAAAAPLSPMARALLDQVLSRATAYTALTEKLSQLEPVIADEHTRYQAAWALIRSSRSIEQVMQSIDMQHLQALEAEQGRFASQLQDRQRAEIGARADEARTLEAGIDEAAQRLARDRERQAQLAREIDAKQQELADVQRQFDAAADAVRQSLARAKSSVRRHLG